MFATVLILFVFFFFQQPSSCAWLVCPCSSEPCGPSPPPDCLRPLGYIVLFGNASGKPAPFDVALLGLKGSLTLTRPGLPGTATDIHPLLFILCTLYIFYYILYVYFIHMYVYFAHILYILILYIF